MLKEKVEDMCYLCVRKTHAKYARFVCAEKKTLVMHVCLVLEDKAEDVCFLCAWRNMSSKCCLCA